MDELGDFGQIVLVVAAGLVVALLASKLSERYPIPAPALFLLSALLIPIAVPQIRTVERLAVVALIVILFDGGMHIGWRRFRVAAVPITLLGTVGTVATAAVMAVCAHYLLGFGWTFSWLIGAALSPTDPAVMFSILGDKQIAGRTGTILEGESGVNDPVGIALMIGIIEYATTSGGSAWAIAWEFFVEMGIGLVIGVVGALALLVFMRRVPLPSQGLYPLRSLAAAGVIYGLASVAHGSGFLAVFIAGLALGDVEVPYQAQIRRFQTSLASLAEIVVFAALGLTINVDELFENDVWSDGLILAVLLAFVARPVALSALLAVTRLRPGERIFVAWSGLKGAVPILLAAFAVLEEVENASRLYDIVFFVVLFSVLVQGSTIPLAARRLGVRMRPA